MKMKNPFIDLSRSELILWISSIGIVAVSFIIASSRDILTLVASLIGATALIFVAKGYVIGQVLMVIFAVFYGIISFLFGYYGEMITYLGMTSPIAIMAVFTWVKNPYKDTAEVKVNGVSLKQFVLMFTLSIIVTVIMYYVLNALGTANLLLSTFSVTTSFIASYLTFLRSEYYALAYAANDIVLIILWILAAIDNISYITMAVCFVIFFVNDTYGFINWQRIKKRQRI